MCHLSLLVAALVMQQSEIPRSLPSANELTQTALIAFKALPPEENWQAKDSMIRALVLTDEDDQAIEVAMSEEQSAGSALRRHYAPALALRLKDVPDEATLSRIAKGDTHERILTLSEITEELAKADQPKAAEQALRMISGHERSAWLQALRASMVAQAYRRTGDEEGERRIIRLGISQSIKTEPAFFVFKDFKTHLRAIALGEKEVVRELVTNASEGAPEFIKLQASDAVTFYCQMSCLHAALDEREEAAESIKAAREKCIQIEREAKDKSGFTNAAYQYIVLNSGLRAAGYVEEANSTFQYAEALFRDGKVEASAFDRRWIYRVLYFNDFETLIRTLEFTEGPAYRTAISIDAARASIDREDPALHERLAAALAEFHKTRLRDLNDNYFSPDSLLLDLAEVHALGGEQETAERLFKRAARRAVRSRTNSEYHLSQVLRRAAEAGLVDVAWSILPTIRTDSPEYARSIATLAAEVAKREAVSTTTK